MVNDRDDNERFIRSHPFGDILPSTGMLSRGTRSIHRFVFVALGLCSRSASAASNTCPSTSMLTVAQFPCLNDNYGYLIHCPETGATAAVDTPEAAAYEKELQSRGWTLTHIFNTHQYVILSCSI